MPHVIYAGQSPAPALQTAGGEDAQISSRSRQGNVISLHPPRTTDPPSLLFMSQIREARESRDALARHRKEVLEDKLQRAEILRESHLQERIRRAQEEEAKVS